MKCQLIDDEYVWNIPIANAPNAQFLQSWEWGVFQQLLGRTVQRFQVVEGEVVVAAMQYVEHRLPFGQHYWYAPRGPIFLTHDQDAYESIVQAVGRTNRDLAERGSVFVRCEPVGNAALTQRHFASWGARSVGSVQPQDELAVVVEHDESALLQAMHEKTRYNVRLAERHGVRARLIEQLDYARRVFPLFWDLLQDTARRQGITTHPRAYYLHMLEYLMPRGMVKLIVAEHDNVIVAGHLLMVFGDTVYYLHGGSRYASRQLMAPVLLHWEGMRLAKRLGKRYYNFGGVAPAGATDHRWQSLTRFKEGFVSVGQTGERLHYVGALDLVASPFWYTMYGVSRRLRRFVR